jgi:DNA-binding response OmpR family regulator
MIDTAPRRRFWSIGQDRHGEPQTPAPFRILLVGDGQTSPVLLRAHLARTGVSADFNLLDEIEHPRSLGVPHDLVMLVLPLRTDDGPAICRRLRTEGMEGLLVILDTDESANDVVAALEAGADGYFTWSMNIEETRARIRALIRRASRVSPAEFSLMKSASATKAYRSG